jgi:membrane protease YdiL (CAAX protease family)
LKKGRNIGILTTLVGLAVLVALFRFNRSTPYGEHYVVGNLIGLLWVPMLFIFFVARDEPARFGFCLGDSWKAWWPTLLLYAGVLVFLVPASRMGMYRDFYPLEGRAVVSTWQSFVFYEARWGLYFFCWEFFFRGFLLFGLHRFIGWWAVLLQALAFGIMHFGKVPTEFVAAFPAGIILGMLALRSKSFLPSFVLHFAAALTFDVLVIWTR